jgi:hypothetical protein
MLNEKKDQDPGFFFKKLGPIFFKKLPEKNPKESSGFFSGIHYRKILF